MIKNLLIAFTFLLTASFTLAQDVQITGKITDLNEKELPGAHIELTYPWGETYKSAVSDPTGNFIIENVSRGGYKYKVTFLGYKDLEAEITVGQTAVNLGVLKMEEGGITIDGVEVTETVPMGKQLGDTTQYNADAFKTLPDATAEDLITKMPGVVLKDGKIQAQGEDVTQVLVDGRRFFGNDPNVALKNLPAEVIDKIQVFDQASEQSQFTGFNDGNTTKTINIITRPEMRNGQFGKLSAGLGYEDKYAVGGNSSLFNGTQRISIIGQSNNINQQNFSTEDLLGVVGQSGGRRGGRGGSGGRRGGSRRGGPGGGGSVNDFLVQQNGGIATTHAAGINYSDKWGESVDITGSYFYNYSDNDATEFIRTQYLDVRGEDELYREDNVSNSINQNHRINLRVNWKLDSVNSLLIRPRLTFQQNEGTSFVDASTLAGTDMISLTNNDFASDLKALDFNNSILYRHRFKKQRRTFSLNLSTGYKENSGDKKLETDDAYYVPMILLDSLDQTSDLAVTGWNGSANLSYTEPIGQNGMLQASYSTSLQEDESDKKTFDKDLGTGEYALLNEPLSSVFKSLYTTHVAGLSYNFRKGRDFTFMIRANYQFANLKSNESFPIENEVNQNFNSVLPFVMMRYNLSEKENLRIFYRSNAQNPSVDQLQNVIDNTNPLQLSIGNPGLDQSVSHRLFARYSKTNPDNAGVFFALVSGTYTQNYIANATFYRVTDNPVFDKVTLSPGTQLSMPVNVDNYFNGRVYLTYGLPVKSIKSNLNLDANYNYSNIPGLINDRINITKNHTFGGGLTISSNISERLDFTVSTRPSYTLSSNSLEDEVNSNYYQQSSSLKFGWVLKNGIVFRTSLVHQFYVGLDDSFDDDFTLWQVGVGKKLFKNQRGEITLSVSDVLNQNQSVSRSITETYVEDIQTNVLQRFIMLTFTYNFLNFTTGKAIPEEESREKRRERMMRERGW